MAQRSCIGRTDALIVAGMLMIGLTACASQPPRAPTVTYTAPSTAPAFTPAVADSLTPPTEAWVAALEAPTPALMLEAGQTVGLESMAWAYLADDAAASSLTVVAGDGGGCEHPAGATVLETSTTVTLLTLSQHLQPPGTACNGDLRFHTYVVQLAAPLGGRTLLHGPTHDAVPLPIPTSS